MNIQNNSNVNFGARRILNVRKAIENGADEVIDIFALGREDKKFMARCNAALMASDRVAVGANAKNNCSYKMFFRDFLNRLSGKDKRSSLDDTYSFVAIKNGEEISGVAEMNEDTFPQTCLSKLITKKQNSLVADGLFYGTLTALKGMFKDISRKSFVTGKHGLLKSNDFLKCQKEIRHNNAHVVFTEVKDTHNYDLEDFLGIKDIETEIIG